MKIAITGATGFVGKHLVNFLLNRGHDVIAIGRNINKLDEYFKSVDKFETDYSFESLVNGIKKVDAIVHLAAKRLSRDTDPFRLNPFINSNILATENLLLAAKENNISKICQTSTIGVYSEHNSVPFKEDEFPSPNNFYGVSKLTCEQIANIFSAQTNVKVTNLRLAYLFGRGEREDLVFMKYLALAKKKLTLQVWGSGKTSVDYIYVKDIVSAIDKAIQPEAPYGTYNIGSGSSYSILEIAKAINEVFDNNDNIQLDGSKKERGGNIFMDCSKAKEMLNWESEFTLYQALKNIKNNEYAK